MAVFPYLLMCYLYFAPTPSLSPSTGNHWFVLYICNSASVL